jgi:hypothetical protein
MIASKRRMPCCSLCLAPSHRAKRTRCPVVCKYKAHLIVWNDVQEMATRLGNPHIYEVEQPDNETRKRINQWFSNGGSNDLPTNAQHLVLLNTHFCATAKLHFNHNLVAVSVLEKRGRELSGWELAYLPAHKVREWLEKHCAERQRKKHCLSVLRKQMVSQQLSLNNIYVYDV